MKIKEASPINTFIQCMMGCRYHGTSFGDQEMIWCPDRSCLWRCMTTKDLVSAHLGFSLSGSLRSSLWNSLWKQEDEIGFPVNHLQ
jgi:hypothetical protein